MQQKYRWWMILLSMTLMGYGCASNTPTSTSQVEPASPDAVVKVAKNAEPESSPPAGDLPEELSPSQDALKRLPQVNAGRANPFGSILPGSVPVRPRTSSAMSSTSTPIPVPPTILEPTVPVATAPIAPLPAPLPAPQVAAAPVTSVPVPAAAPAAIAPAPSLPSLAAQIRISGIVQIGNQLNVLVEVPNGGGSRPVRVGEDIITGRVRLARVDVAANQEPQIVLEEGGVETIKTVDSGV
ncbi:MULTISPECIES: hypothetical protein [unclassified Leptolyngbya]|uniref:hypothetical protein n=1 Tax=unclassified Leptolyngbya TaxID=2650499 RepID=UPI0016889C0B|nr:MULTISPECIES: hypothetical protein [unclassified Leptolyngbya]MBD1909966.1 hypothetical protein [Leptolyngbya sp. FACHB-8]MBD2156039.1 hypothetical protein [Leptolyngbya sp. FACHB-16]